MALLPKTFQLSIGWLWHQRSSQCIGMQQEIPSYPPDRPLRLAVAARAAFPDGSMTVSGLRREARRGRLVVERIAGKDYTTLTNIERMRELCRVEVRAPAFGCNHPDERREVSSSSAPCGLSETVELSGALARARAKFERLKEYSHPTLAKRSPRESGNATLQRSG